MGRRKEISTEKRSTILSLCPDGLTMRQTARPEHIYLVYVNCTLQRRADTGQNVDRPRKDRPKVTLKGDDKYLVVKSKRDPFKTAPVLVQNSAI